MNINTAQQTDSFCCSGHFVGLQGSADLKRSFGGYQSECVGFITIIRMIIVIITWFQFVHCE